MFSVFLDGVCVQSGFDTETEAHRVADAFHEWYPDSEVTVG